jgi:hypothetical protein
LAEAPKARASPDYSIRIQKHTVKELVDYILSAQGENVDRDYLVHAVGRNFELSGADAQLAVDRASAGISLARTPPYDPPDELKDPVASDTYRRFGGAERKKVYEIPPFKFSIPWRAVRWVAVSLLLSFLATTAKLWLDKVDADRTLHEEVARLDDAEPGWTFEELEARRRPIAPEENGALQVIAIAEEIPGDWPIWTQIEKAPQWEFFPKERDPAKKRLEEQRKALGEEIDSFVPRASLSPVARKTLESELERAAPARAKARDLVRFSDGRYPFVYQVIWPQTLVRELQDARRVAYLLQLESLAEAHKGNGAAAAQAVLRIACIARSVGDENTMIAYLVRVSVMSIAVGTTECALALGTADPATLLRLQEVFEKEDKDTPHLARDAVVFERALTHRMFMALWEGKITLAQMRNFKAEPDSWWDRFALNFGLAPLRRQHAVFLRELTDELGNWDAAWDPRKSQMASGPNNKWHEQYLAGVIKFRQVQPRIQAYVRSAALALAAERFRLETGAWPKTLDELAQAYIKEIPPDPFGKETMRMARKEDSIVIYSVSMDGQDNGGNLDRDGRQQPGTDYGFQLWDPAARKPS